MSGWSGLKSKISSIESDQMLLRDRVLSEIMALKAKVSELDSTIQAQNAEIKQVKSENERLLCMHISRYSGKSRNDKSTTNSQCAIDHVAQDENSIMDFKTADSNDDTIQDIQEVLCVSSSEEPRSYKSVESTSEKQIEGENNAEAIKEHSLIQDTNKATGSKRNATRSASTVLQDNEFIGVQRNRVKTRRYYIGGIAETTKKEAILHFLNTKGISPTLLSLFPSKRKGTLSAKMNIRAEDVDKINAEDFWPRNVYCRPWVSKEELINSVRGKEKLSDGRKAERTNVQA